MPPISRRGFLKSSSLGAPAVLGAAGWAAAVPAATSTADSPQPVAGETYRLTREVPVDAGYDLVVAGGGPGGAAAAICAARLGAKVLLIEATGCLGGMGTSGLVTAFNPMANGERMLVGGLMREIVTALHARGFLAPHVTADFYSKRFQCWTPFRVEGYKLVLDELVAAAGVEVRFFTRVIEADAEPTAGTVRGVIAHNIEGLL